MRPLLLVALLLAAAGATLAQDKPNPQKAEQLVELGFKYRRDGELAAAGAAYDEAIKLFADKAPERRAAVLDAYDVAWVESKWERAARVVHGVDPVREVRALAFAGK